MNKIETVSIELKPGVYNQFRFLNHKVWYALSEFVDNAVQSFLDNREKLFDVDKSYQFRIDIDIDFVGKAMSIKDNAGGINEKNFVRAFEPANIPMDATGLNEFGMGMKTAAIWLADNWSVQSTALNENVIRKVVFDLKSVISENKEDLNVMNDYCDPKAHFTEIRLYNLSRNAPSNNQMDKIRRHLESIYRKFIRKGDLILCVNGEILKCAIPEILRAPYYKTPDAHPIKWEKKIDFKAGKYRAVGFIGILEKMSSSVENGLSLFRRGRVIVGSHDEKYRPKELCGQVGSPRYKRIVGELELEGFEVSFNKSSFQETEELDYFISKLKKQLISSDFDLFGQAEGFRQKSNNEIKQISTTVVNEVSKKTSDSEQLSIQIQESIQKVDEENKLNFQQNRTVSQSVDQRSFSFSNEGIDYELILETYEDVTDQNLYDLINIPQTDASDNRKYKYRLNLGNSFFTTYLSTFKRKENYTPIVMIVQALVLAEVIALERGTDVSGDIRNFFNKFLLYQE